MPLFGRHQSHNDQSDWLPDQSLPYVIHYPGRDNEEEARNRRVCIWPRARHISNSNQDYDLLEYTLNRTHFCEGRILEKSTSSIRFADNTGHFGILFGHHGPVTVTIAVMTDDEFETVKRIYEDKHWPTLQTKGDLVKNFIECLDD